MLRPILAVGLPALVLWLLTVSISFANPRDLHARPGGQPESSPDAEGTKTSRPKPEIERPEANSTNAGSERVTPVANSIVGPDEAKKAGAASTTDALRRVRR